MSVPTFNRNIILPRNRYNRGTDTKQVDRVSTPTSVGLYTIDHAILTHLQSTIKPVVTQDKKQIKVPIVYGTPERWKSVQIDGSIRDKNGKLMLPIIMLRRTGIKKNSMNSPVNKYQQYVFKTGWNSRNIYSQFSVRNNIRPSEVYHTTIIPDYYDVSYEAMIWTEYVEQMNFLVENISFESNEYWGTEQGYRFITTVDDIQQLTDLPNNNDRMVRSKFTMNVKAYLLPPDAIDRSGNRRSSNSLQYSPKKVVFTSEIVV